MPISNQIAISDVNNVAIFDKRTWDDILPIQIIANDPILQSPLVSILNSCKLDSGGIYATSTFTRRLSSRWDKMASKTDIEVEGIGQIRDGYTAISRYKAWGQEELVKDITGNDLLKEIEKATTQYWSDNFQYCILDMLRGIFDGPLKTTHQLDASTHTMGWEVVEAAKQKLGDVAQSFKVLIMHSLQLSNLKQAGVVKYRDAATLGYDVIVKGEIPSINGLPIIVTDSVPITEVAGVKHYHAYIGAPGMIEFRIINFRNKTHWDTLAAGTDYLLQTCRIMTRVPGVSFVLSNAADEMNPSDTDFINPLCWKKVAQRDKDIPFVEIITKAETFNLDPEPEPEP